MRILLAQISAEVLDQPVDLTNEVIKNALDPVAFVAARKTLGGAAPSATASILDSQSTRLADDRQWLVNEKQRLEEVAAELNHEVETIVRA